MTLQSKTRRSILPKEAVEVRQGAAPIPFGITGAGPQSEMIATVRAVPIRDPLGARLAALVVGVRVMVRAVQADVKIGAATVAFIAEPYELPRCQGDRILAGVTPHPDSLGQIGRTRHRVR